MLKQRFLKNSAKVIMISTILLFVSNAIVWGKAEFSALEEKLGFLSILPELVVYIFTFLVYLALNDEKAAHRKIRDIKSQKKVRLLKFFLLFVFISNFFKASIEKALLNSGVEYLQFLSDFYIVLSSFSFFLLLLSVWYFVRDKNEGPIKYASLASIVVSVIYSGFKFVSLSLLRDGANPLLIQRTQYVMCLFQYAVNILMLLLIKIHYEKEELLSEQEEAEVEKPKRPEVIENIASESGFGIDFIDDVE